MGPHDQEMDEFYKRTVLWKKWREETNVRMSKDRARKEAAKCTFQPKLNETSKKIVQDGPRYPVKDLVSLAAQSTPAPPSTSGLRSKSAPRMRTVSSTPGFTRSGRTDSVRDGNASHDGYSTPYYATYTISNDVINDNDGKPQSLANQ